MSGGLIIAGVIGAILGAWTTYVWRFSERRRETVPVPPSDIPPGAETVLSVLSSSAVIVDASDHVLQASAPAVAMGLVRDDRLPESIMHPSLQVAGWARFTPPGPTFFTGCDGEMKRSVHEPSQCCGDRRRERNRRGHRSRSRCRGVPGVLRRSAR